jgi:2-phosphosulfolactate phosphatase
MKADVLLYPQALSNQVLSDKKVVVIDVLRATSTIVTALAHRALELIPVNDPSEAIELIRSIGAEECVLGGEQKGFKIEGFDLGNSPADYTEAKIAGKKVILCTTNGTRAIKRVQGAAEVLIGSYLNLQKVVDYLGESDRDLLIVCAGREQNISLEDLSCAGMILQLLKAQRSDMQMTDGAAVARLIAGHAQPEVLENFLKSTEHGSYLLQIGMEPDIPDCASLNQYPVLPRYLNGKIIID